ncbi:MAG: transposase domain-containing protein [Candidatus Binataceae bacterium]
MAEQNQTDLIVTTRMIASLPSYCRENYDATQKAAQRWLYTTAEKSGAKVAAAPSGRHHSLALPAAIVRAHLAPADALALERMTGGEAAEIVAAVPIPGVAALSADEAREALHDRFDRSSDRKKNRAIRRAEIAREIDETAESINAATGRRVGFKRAYKIVAAAHGLKVPTIRRWSEAIRGRDRGDYAPLLLDDHAGRSRGGDYDPQFDSLFRSLWLKRNKPTAKAAADNVLAIISGTRDAGEARARGVAVPAVGSLLRKLRREVHPEVIILARHGVETLKARHYIRRDRSALYAGQYYGGDGHYSPKQILFPDGESRLAVTYFWHDLYSSRMLGCRTGKTEDRNIVRLSFGDACVYAVPQTVGIDNGRGGASKWNSGGAPTRFRFKVRPEEPLGLFAAMGVAVRFTTPYHGQSKPIERAFREVDDRLRARPDLAVYGNKPIPLAVYERALDEEVVCFNARVGRRTAIAAGRSFNQVWSESIMAHPPRVATQAQLRLCLLAAEEVRVSDRDGRIRIFGNEYGGELADRLAGRKIVARFDPDDLQDTAEALHLYEGTGEYLGAIGCLLPAGFNDASAARDIARLRASNLKLRRRELETERLIGDKQLAAMMPTVGAADGAAVKVVKPLRLRIDPPRGLPESRPHDRIFEALEKVAEQSEAALLKEIA